jgi:RNA polymerase sigma-70 factor, ECF subfamily
MPEQPSAAWLNALLDGDEAAVAEFWREYGGRLNRLADRHLSPQLQRRVAADDVIQSVCRTFFRRAREGQFELADAEALWRLLCVITLTKCRLLARFHGREQRGLDREQPLAGAVERSGAAPHEPAADDPPPEQAAELADELAKLLSGLDAEEQQLVELKLQERSNDEIAAQMHCSERTVRRVLHRVQSRLRRLLEEPSSD